MKETQKYFLKERVKELFNRLFFSRLLIMIEDRMILVMMLFIDKYFMLKLGHVITFPGNQLRMLWLFNVFISSYLCKSKK